MSDWKKITLADLEMLPVGYQKTIPESYLDEFKHMNVMWYTHLFSYGLDEVFNRVGLTNEWLRDEPRRHVRARGTRAVHQ